MESSMKIWMSTGGYPMSLEWVNMDQPGIAMKIRVRVTGSLTMMGARFPGHFPCIRPIWLGLRTWEWCGNIGMGLLSLGLLAKRIEEERDFSWRSWEWVKILVAYINHINHTIFGSSAMVLLRHFPIPFRGWPRCWVHNSRSGCWPMAQWIWCLKMDTHGKWPCFTGKIWGLYDLHDFFLIRHGILYVFFLIRRFWGTMG